MSSPVTGAVATRPTHVMLELIMKALSDTTVTSLTVKPAGTRMNTCAKRKPGQMPHRHHNQDQGQP
jgi:hypothetical protein